VPKNEFSCVLGDFIQTHLVTLAMTLAGNEKHFCQKVSQVRMTNFSSYLYFCQAPNAYIMLAAVLLGSRRKKILFCHLCGHMAHFKMCDSVECHGRSHVYLATFVNPYLLVINCRLMPYVVVQTTW
jgi:hypothetical protein